MKQLLTLLFILSISWFSAHADNDPTNDTCAGSELISEMNLITTDASHEEGPASFTKSVDADDYYHFTISTAGTLDFFISSADTVDVTLTTAACGSFPAQTLTNVTSDSASLNINAGDTVRIWVEGKNNTYDYGFDLVFKKAVSPTAVEDTVQTWVDTPIGIDVTANDTDDGSIDKTTVTIINGVNNGTTSVDAITGIVTYTPNSGFSGTDSFSYTVEDNLGNISNEITVVILTKVPPVEAENCDTGTQNAYREFCLRKQTMLPGNMVTIGNTILVAPYNGGADESSNSSADCTTYTNGDYIDNASTANNNYNLCAYHEGGAGQPANTSATVTFPDAANSEIEWAGLYWQSIVPDTYTLDGHTIRIKNGTGTWAADGVALTPDKLNYLDTGYENDAGEDLISYSAFKDVTDIFTTNGWKDGKFSVADIPVQEGQVDQLGTYGAWTLVIIYRNSSESIRSFTVFDGWQRIDGGSNDNVPIPVSGFYTPKAGDINASVSVFTAEGDKHIDGDTLTVEDQTNGSAEVTLTHVTDNTFHSGIYGVESRTPDPTNNQGIDIHTYALGNVNNGENVLAHEQSDVTFRFKSDGDVYWPSMLAFTTEVYTPSFCYDYAYQQNGIFITEENNDTLRDPRITGLVTNGDDLNVTLYIRNQEDSDVIAQNLELNILDINTSQATYKPETVSILNADEVVALPVPDSSLTVSTSYIRGINYNPVAGDQWIYAYYTLTPNLPTALNNEINISLNAEFNYDLILTTPTGGTVTIPSTSTAGGTNLPLCSSGNFEFIKKEAWGIFNVVDSDVYAQGEYYNIPTQVVRRVGNFSVIAYDTNTSNVDYKETQDNNSTTLVGIDMIDAGAFHDIEATCSEATSGISPILWMNFENSGSIDLRQEIADAIADERLTINSVDEYFPNAVQSAAFRIHYLTLNDGSEDLIKTEPAGGDNVKLINFTELVQDIGECKQPVRKFPDSDLTTTQVPVACANAGNAGLNPFEVQRCLECLFGYNTTHVCSRDNFSIRPESFNVKINDSNQTFPPVYHSRLADNVTGVASPVATPLDLASEWRYHFEINATTHVGNEAAPGYSRYFNPFFPQDFNATLIWEPLNTSIDPYCNDANSTSLAFNMINGEINAMGDHKNVGKYRFNVVDKGWTKVDWDINGDAMKHHRDNPGNYIGGAIGTDCDTTTSNVLTVSSTTDATGATLSNINGCTIDSNNHNNVDNSDYVNYPAPLIDNGPDINVDIKYRDYDITFHPYYFDVTTVAFQKGNFSADANITAANAYIYNNSINNNSDDLNMAVRYTGLLRAAGAAGNSLTNFVQGCYAKDINLDINTSNINLTGYPDYEYRLRERNITGDIIRDTIRGTNGTANNLIGLITLPGANFEKTMEGSADIELNINFDRSVNAPINPIVINYDDLNATCSTLSECDSLAGVKPGNIQVNSNPSGYIDSNISVVHLYARVHSPRQRVANPNPSAGITATIPLYYEFYCNSALGSLPAPCTIGDYAANPAISPFAILSPDDVRWYSQNLHTIATDGNATATQARSVIDQARFSTNVINAGAQTANYTYLGPKSLGGKGYPYKTTIDLFAPNWLIYNRFNAAATVNDFELEFYSTGQFTEGNIGIGSVDANSSINVNRRIQW